MPQAYAGYATEVARETADEVFVEPSATAVLPSQEPEPDPSNLIPAAVRSPSGLPSASPSPTPAPVDPRITGLIVGVDSGVGRNTYLTDTMIVVSIDPATKTVSMVSVPRDMVDVPLADGRKFRGKINGLVSYVRNHPKQFPGSTGPGFDVLMGALGKLLGVKIDYYATVDPRRLRAGRQHARWGQRERRPRLLRLALQRVRLRATASPSRPASTTSTATRRSRMRASGSPPARATSRGPPASRRSSRASATRS